MSLIQQFQEVRRDGKVIAETMTPEEMIRAGWTPDKVLLLQWQGPGGVVELQSSFGFLSRVVASREYLAVLEDTDAGGQSTVLSVYQADGRPRVTFQNNVPIKGAPEVGRFASFRSPQSGAPAAFAVLFDVFSNGARYLIEIDAASGGILSCEEVH